MKPFAILPAGLLYAALHMFLLAEPALSIPNPNPNPSPAPFNGALFPNSRASSFVNSFKKSDLDNSDFSCTRNGKPCDGSSSSGNNGDNDGDDGDDDDDDGQENGDNDDDDDDDEDDEDDDSTVTYGHIDYDEYTTPDGVDHISAGGKTLKYSNDQYTDSGYSSDGDESYDDLEAEVEAETETEEENQSSDESYTCTRNGYPCGQFPAGAGRDLTIERTKSCTRNGIPCDQFPEGADEDGEEKFTINKSNDSYKTCTRNGMPCEEYDRLVAQGITPPTEQEYQIQAGGGHAPQANQVERAVAPPVQLIREPQQSQQPQKGGQRQQAPGQQPRQYQQPQQQKQQQQPQQQQQQQPPQQFQQPQQQAQQQQGQKKGPCTTCNEGEPDDEQLLQGFRKNPGKPGFRGFNWGDK